MSKGYFRVDEALDGAKRMLVDALTDYVMWSGEDFHESYDYYRDEFGIDEEETEEGTDVLKIVNIFDNGGCYFPFSRRRDLISTEDGGEVDWFSVAFYALYVVEEFGVKRLKYYALCNQGNWYNSDKSEPDHGYATGLSLQALEKLSEFILVYDACLQE